MKISKQYFATTLLMLLFFIMNACVAESGKSNMTNSDKSKNHIVAGELIVDAVPNAKMYGHEMYADDMDVPFYSSAVTRQGNRAAMGFPLPRIPQQVRVIWRKNNDVSMRSGKIVYGGPLAGDYTIPVASRIPEAVLAEVRNNGGALRIKFRLKPDGVMLGWDIQRRDRNEFVYSMAGGDFLDILY